MRVLLIGGSGFVGSMTLPYLAERHKVRVFDLRPPRADLPGMEYIEGNVMDFGGLRAAAASMQAFVYMAMGPLSGWGEMDNVGHHFDVNVKGLYLALWAASEAGVNHGVQISSMSVYAPRQGPRPDETVPPDAVDFYGLTKRFAEQVCEAAVTERQMSVVSLRLCLPTPDDEWQAVRGVERSITSTSGRDAARAILAALEYAGHGFDAITVSGDHQEQIMTLGKAKRKLGWQPLDRRE